MSTKAIDLRRGMTVNYKGGLWTVIDNQKVAKGNWRSSQVIQVKNLQTGQLIEERFRTEELFEQAYVERKAMNYLYSDATHHLLMDMQTFEEVRIPAEFVGDKSIYLTPNLELVIGLADGHPVTADLPNTVELLVEETPPDLRGATATNSMKEAKCEGGARVKVPSFVKNGDHLLVDTRTGEYVSRA